ncbi:L-tyrosine:2-oxoglutarate aminotransferase [Cristinia sonorae]|uniref:L-tyrosine:2-oxoglutarate aminotransferase n=1 Tax=Cristinia sonorae TaxID=1940300 RepID=A0A8K0UY38_9AGAR|nr:L-tyrosine:2-oxoglutarate aminotransferase [Cristinia sonorae]
MSLDLSHHLSSEARIRRPNPMKAIWRLARRKADMISLANGDPHFSLYPIRKVEFEVASVGDNVDDPVASWRLSGGSAPSQTFSSSTESSPGKLPLKSALQYSAGAGLPDAQRAVTELTNYYHSPPDHIATLTLGNGDGVAKLFRLLGDAGDHFLADEFSFSSLTNAPLSHGIKWVSVKIDEGGLIPENLKQILANWNVESQGKRPHVLYTVPCGQNPTGSTLSLERRQRIYELAQRFDFIIIEDDPYYYLQYDPLDFDDAMSDAPFQYIPSFLSMDIDGRVMRVDSFSKIMAPGMRLGWITSNPTFHEHLVHFTDSSTHHPHAFGQIFITEMLSSAGWQLSGFDRWIRSLRLEYQRRRDIFMRAFLRDVASTGLATADFPEAGMFVWIKVDIEKHPRFRRSIVGAQGDLAGVDQSGVSRCLGPKTNVAQLMEELFERCLDDGLVVMPASIFVTPSDAKVSGSNDEPIEDRLNFMRATFAGPEETMEPALRILANVLKNFFADSSSGYDSPVADNSL